MGRTAHNRDRELFGQDLQDNQDFDLHDPVNLTLHPVHFWIIMQPI